MIATPHPCLSEQEFIDFAAGRLPGQRFQLLLAHLDDCRRCQQRVEETSRLDDPFAAALLHPESGQSDDCEIIAEADCQAAIFHASRSPGNRLDSMVPPIESLGPYRLLRPLGRGGMGAVYLAEHIRLRKKCAVKLLPRERGFDADWLQRFDREMQAVASLEHANIVKATDAGDVDGWHYLVMEFLDGLDLATVVRRLGPMPIDIAVAIVRDVCKALAVIHKAGLVHRDVKPSNVMLTCEGVVKVLDLGLVLDGHQAESNMRLTTVGRVIGTLAFAAPEQLSFDKSVDARADLYGVGAMLFQMVAGTPAHQSDRGIAPLVVEKTSKSAPPLSRFRDEVPDGINDLVARLLDRNPDGRPSDAEAVAEALEPYAAEGSLKRFATKAMRAAGGDDSVTEPAVWGGQLSLQEQHEPPGRWSSMLGVFGMPLTFAVLIAGFLIYVQTDRGMLVIESDLDAEVSISQAGEPIDTLEISPGENTTVLRSGRYSVVVSEGSDNVSVSESEVVIQRGTETVVTVRQQAEPTALMDAQTQATDGKLYKGEPIQHWIGMMEVEHDVSTLTDAMNAIASLSNDSDVDAAHAILKSARRMGGWILSNDDSKPSQKFMSAFNAIFGRLMPQPGIRAVTRELDQGNRKSHAACIRSLLNFDTGMSTVDVREAIGIESWAKDPANKRDAFALHDALKNLLRSPDTSRDPLSMTNARDLSLKIALATGQPVASEPELHSAVDQELEKLPPTKSLEERVAEINDRKPSFYASMRPIHAIAAIQLGIKVPTAVAVRALLALRGEFRSERNELFLEGFNDQPQRYADEAVLALSGMRFAGIGGIGYGGEVGFLRINPGYAVHFNEELWTRILVRVAQETSHPDIAKRLLSEIEPGMSVQSRPSGSDIRYQMSEETYSVVQKALRLAESRLPPVAAETASESDEPGQKYMKVAERIIDRYDKNSDHALSQSEWKPMLVSPAEADADGDSRITVTEYARWMQSKN